MAVAFGDRLKHAWNAFTGRDIHQYVRNLGTSYTYRPDIHRYTPIQSRH